MKNLLSILLCLMGILDVQAQYYLRGEIKDERNEPIQNARINLQSDKLLYYSGTSGGFGIPSGRRLDSLTINAEGYESQSVQIDANVFLTITLKAHS
ncbi:MAG: carboxypeptidase-like regulatory domain-containing protein, partial [Ferruginibacter sp.]